MTKKTAHSLPFCVILIIDIVVTVGKCHWTLEQFVPFILPVGADREYVFFNQSQNFKIQQNNQENKRLMSVGFYFIK